MGIENWQNISIKADDSCPIATRDIAVNLKNRQNAIDTAGYGPLNPKKPNDEFWNAKAERWDVSPQEAQQQKCGNCAAFIKSERMLKCIDEGLGNESGNAAWDVIEAGELGYCEAFDFKCASARTCDAWIVGGPITEEKEKNMEEKSLDELFNELLEIEEKVAPIVPVVPMPSQRNIPGPKRPGQRPRIVAPGMANPNFRRGYKAVDEESYEDDEYAMYDDMYEGQNSRNKRIGGSPDTREARNNASLRAVGDFFGGRATPSGSPDTTEARGRSRVNNLGSVIARSLGPQIPGPVGDDRRASLRPNRGPGWGGTAPRPRTVNAPNPPIPQGRNRNKKPRDWGSDNAAQQISGGIPIKSAWDEEVYYDYGYFDTKSGVPYSSTRRNSFKYGPWEPRGNPGAGVMQRRAIENISDAMPYRRGKGSDAEMYWDEEDEVAIPPDIDGGKALTTEQSAALTRTANFYSGRNMDGSSYGSADTMAARGARRRSDTLEHFGKEGPKRPGKYSAPKQTGKYSTSKPKPPASKRPSGITGSADSMERRIMGRRPSGSPGGNAPRRPSANPSTPPKKRGSNSLLGSLQGNYDENQTGPKFFGRRLW